MTDNFVYIYNGVTIASYSYDVSGKVLSVKNSMGYDVTNSATHIGNISPFRYRGYVYDFETGLYYLQSRYYDPVTTRFINADVYCDTDSGSPLSTNMFSYCENNSIIGFDSRGEAVWWIQSSNAPRYVGHTSLLIQEKPGYWWYFFWSGKSIQLLFLGTTTFEKLTGYVDCLQIMYNVVFNIDLQYDESYTSYIHFSGNFKNSLNYMFSYMDRMGYRQMLLRYNPHVSSTQNMYDYYNVSQISSNKIHSIYKGKWRPYSRVIYFDSSNPFYNLFTKNCMQMSVELLLKGKFNRDDYYYKATLRLIKNNISTPNLAFVIMNFFDNMSKIGFPFTAYCFLLVNISKYDNMHVQTVRNILSSFYDYFY